jgi:hypothetical protein
MNEIIRDECVVPVSKRIVGIAAKHVADRFQDGVSFYLQQITCEVDIPPMNITAEPMAGDAQRIPASDAVTAKSSTPFVRFATELLG